MRPIATVPTHRPYLPMLSPIKSKPFFFRSLCIVFFWEKIRELWCFDVKKVWRQCPSKYSAQWLLKSNHIPKVHRMTRLSDVILDLQLQGVGANHHATLIKSMARQFTKKQSPPPSSTPQENFDLQCAELDLILEVACRSSNLADYY